LVLPIKYYKNERMTEDKMSGACGPYNKSVHSVAYNFEKYLKPVLVILRVRTAQYMVIYGVDDGVCFYTGQKLFLTFMGPCILRIF
jgi:hypothetical protein